MRHTMMGLAGAAVLLTITARNSDRDEFRKQREPDKYPEQQEAERRATRRYRSTRKQTYRIHGLNGPRAVARRLRQIAAGRLEFTLEAPIARLTDEQCRAVRDYMVSP